MDDIKKLMFDTEIEVLEQIAHRANLIWIDPSSNECSAMQQVLEASGYAKNRPSDLRYRGQPVYFQIWWRTREASDQSADIKP